jgi:hypothetical protein
VTVFLPVAHGLLIGRQDLPIPAWLFAWAASVVLIVSFVALTALWREPRFEDERRRQAPAGLSRLVVNRVVEVLAGALGVFLLGVVVWSGLHGTAEPDRNFSLTFVFITFWLGGVVLSVLLGNVFRALSPWRAIARVAAGGLTLLTGQRQRAPLRYPEWLGRWPAAAALAAFVWLELVWASPGFASVGLEPRTAAIATLAYSAYTLMGMALFGIEVWASRGEAFSVYFGMFSRIAPLEVRDGRLGVRRAIAALGTWAVVPGSIALILASIGTTTFDGAQEGVFSSGIKSIYDIGTDAGLSQITANRVAETLFMALALAGVAAIYWIGVWGMRTVDRTRSVRELGTAFAHTLVPIGLAYLVAHYFSYFVFGQQAQFTYLLSDPLGDGSDIFGTAGSGINYTLLGATLVWYVQVGTLVAGHVTALTLAHDRALRLYGDARRASMSQRWMLLVMVAFTCLGLFLLSQSNA